MLEAGQNDPKSAAYLEAAVYALGNFSFQTILATMQKTSKYIRSCDESDARQIVTLVRRLSRQRGRTHPHSGTIEVPLDLLNQISRLATLYEGGTLPVHQDLCHHCPLATTTVLVSEQDHE